MVKFAEVQETAREFSHSLDFRVHEFLVHTFYDCFE